MNRLEALAMAIAAEHRSFESSSDAFRTLNPGLLKWHAVPSNPKKVDAEGYRVFKSYKDGHFALLVNLTAKCTGRAKANGDKGLLSSTSTLAELCKTFRGINVRNVVEFLKDSLDDSAISERTPIGFFCSDETHG